MRKLLLSVSGGQNTIAIGEIYFRQQGSVDRGRISVHFDQAWKPFVFVVVMHHVQITVSGFWTHVCW